jgi:hypothetical protein
MKLSSTQKTHQVAIALKNDYHFCDYCLQEYMYKDIALFSVSISPGVRTKTICNYCYDRYLDHVD